MEIQQAITGTSAASCKLMKPHLSSPKTTPHPKIWNFFLIPEKLPESSEEVREEEQDGLEQVGEPTPDLLPSDDVLFVVGPHLEAAGNADGCARADNQLKWNKTIN